MNCIIIDDEASARAILKQFCKNIPDLDVVEENHELFFKNKIVPISNQIKSLKK